METQGSALLAPDPDRGWSREVIALGHALVVPPTTSAMVQDCGVFLRDGTYCPQAVTWRGGKPMMLQGAAPPPQATAMLEGRHVWAGQIWSHFGHWMCESLSRVWAFGVLDAKIDGIIFIPKRPQRRQTLHGYHEGFLRLMGLEHLQVSILTEPTEVEELIVPGQGFGIGRLARGTPEFRRYFMDHFGEGIAPEGPKKLYVSRSALGGDMGGVLLEKVLEANLAAQGYTIIHPEKLSLEVQIAHYRAATHILGLDGSAFHLFGFVARPDQKCGMILRRNSAVFQTIVEQIRGFTGTDPDVFKILDTDWIPRNHGRPSRNSFGQMNFEKLRDALLAAGYIDSADGWTVPTIRQVKRAVLEIAKRKNTEMISTRRLRRLSRLARLNKGDPAGAAVIDVDDEPPEVDEPEND